MRNRLFALAFVPLLGLLTTAVLADVSGRPDDSANATNLVYDDTNDEIKSAKQCGDATFFKNAFPSLTNGTPGGTDSIDFVVDGKTVRVDIEWYDNNSFDLTVSGGWSPRVGVTVDKNNFVYEYADPTVGIDDPVDGFRDFGLNYYGGAIADDVNHLDLCLETLDTAAPGVSIRVEPTSDGTIFGTVSIIATVIDESPVDPNLLTITIVREADGVDFTPVFTDPTSSACDPVQPGCTEFTWTWDSSTVPSDVYRITVGATDTSALANVGSESILVTVSLENCLEGDDGVTGGEGGTQGCNPTGFMWNELPEELRNSGLLDGETLTQAAVPALASAQDDLCGEVDPNTGEPLYPFVARDPRWGEVTPGAYNYRPLDLSEVFDLAAVVPGYVPPAPTDPPLVEMRADTRGEPCLALLWGEASFSFEDFYDGTVSLFGANRYTYAVTQLPETPDLGLPIPPDIGPLGAGQIDLQKVLEATYAPTDRYLETFIGNQLGPFTNASFNPQRAKIPEYSFFGLGTVQICVSLLGSGLDPTDGRPYYDAVLECSTDLAVAYFDDLDALLAYVGEPSLPDYPDACLVSPSAENLRVELNKARSMIKVGDWTKAKTRLGDLLTDVEQGIWLVDDRNCPGHVVMRLENLLWRNAQLELAESLLPLPLP